MRILFLTTSFNGMAQRLWTELDRRNHEVVIVIFTRPEQVVEQVRSYNPDLIIAPYLNQKIPAEIWQSYTCLIVHPGIKGDRGASSLDWAILRNEKTWGVTILEAVEKMDAGDIWASETFEMRPVSKSELYRCEVTQAATKAVLKAVERFEQKDYKPEPLDYSNPEIKGKWNRRTRFDDFAFDWNEKTATILRKIRAADGSPGAPAEIYGETYLVFGAHPEGKLRGKPGQVLARRHEAVCVATGDGALWISHVKEYQKPQSLKLPATYVLGEKLKHIPENTISPFEPVAYKTYRDIRFERDEENPAIGYLHFDFYNGAMSADHCRRLQATFMQAKKELKVIVLTGGRDMWSNGIHLNLIEASRDPAEASWENILAIDDLIREIILSTDHYVISALQGNAGAGGVSLALAADKILAREGIVLNPHTKNMGLYGSEYWTYLLPKRIGFERAQRITEDCLPWGVHLLHEAGVIDGYYGQTPGEFMEYVRREARHVASLPYFDKLLKAKKFQRLKDERNKPLEQYRKEELEKMRRNFFENDWQYNERRKDFVYKIFNPEFHLPENLYAARRKIFRRRKWESYQYTDRK